MNDANQVVPEPGEIHTNGPQVIGLEVWTGFAATEAVRGASKVTYQHPTAYYSADDEGVVAMGQDGYPGGTFWIRYEDGTTHAYLENAVRRVVLK